MKVFLIILICINYLKNFYLLDLPLMNAFKNSIYFSYLNFFSNYLTIYNYYGLI